MLQTQHYVRSLNQLAANSWDALRGPGAAPPKGCPLGMLFWCPTPARSACPAPTPNIPALSCTPRRGASPKPGVDSCRRTTSARRGLFWSFLNLPPSCERALQPSPGLGRVDPPPTGRPAQAAAHRDALELRLVQQVVKLILGGLDLLLVGGIHHVPAREGQAEHKHTPT